MKIIYRKSLLIIFFYIIVFSANSQENKIYKNTLGINIAELPALTINVNYSHTVKPFLDFVGNTGYSFNHTYGRDLNYFLVPHIDCGNCGIRIKNQTGGFVKIGLILNTSKSYKKRKYFFIGINFINSIVYEKADFSDYYSDCESQSSTNTVITDDPIKKQTKYIFGIGTLFGYSFKISNKLQSDFGLQAAFPHSNYKSLFGYRNYIPGIGYKDSYSHWFPTLIINIKYTIE